MSDFTEMTILQQCVWYMAHGAPDRVSIRRLTMLVEEHKREIEGLDHATVAILEEMDTGYARRLAQMLDVYRHYLEWARKQIGESNA